MNFSLCYFLALLVTTGLAQNPSCDYAQNVLPNRVYYVYSPNYPANYSGQMQCRWQASCPSGYRCRLDCSDINLPQSYMCSGDRLLISRTGDPLLTAADRYCGRGTLSVLSNEQRLSIALITYTNTPGGRFSCQLTAQWSGVAPTPCRCGQRNMNRIVGGQETGVNEFPMMAGIVYVEIIQIKCGGVIISKRHVMSAAHCVTRRTIDDTAVIVGEHNVSSGADSSATRGYRLQGIMIHPLYTTTNNNYDVSVLTVNEDIVFTARVGPVCLPFKFINDDFAGAKVTILGWGTIFTGGPTSPVLQKVDVDVISQRACTQRMPSVTPQQMCTYTPGKDACQDDSGGPLLYTDPSNGLLYSVGIVSYGSFCASTLPGINTRVTTILDWVVAVTQMDFCRI